MALGCGARTRIRSSVSRLATFGLLGERIRTGRRDRSWRRIKICSSDLVGTVEQTRPVPLLNFGTELLNYPVGVQE